MGINKGAGLDELIAAAKARQGLPPAAERRPIRERAKVSQVELAAEVGCSDSAIGMWEQGIREPRGELLARYAAVLRALRETVDV